MNEKDSGNPAHGKSGVLLCLQKTCKEAEASRQNGQHHGICSADLTESGTVITEISAQENQQKHGNGSQQGHNQPQKLRFPGGK